MATTYNINFNNNTGEDNTYAFFVSAPQNATPGSFNNIWISQMVPAGGWFDITTTDQFYACMYCISSDKPDNEKLICDCEHIQGPVHLRNLLPQMW